jgi:hypothetical protein
MAGLVIPLTHRVPKRTHVFVADPNVPVLIASAMKIRAIVMPVGNAIVARLARRVAVIKMDNAVTV